MHLTHPRSIIRIKCDSNRMTFSIFSDENINSKKSYHIQERILKNVNAFTFHPTKSGCLSHLVAVISGS